MLTSIMPESFIYGHHHPENHQVRNDRFTGQPSYFDRKCGPLSNDHYAKCLRQFAGQI